MKDNWCCEGAIPLILYAAVLAFVLPCVGGIVVVSPTEGSTVSQLWPEQKEFFATPLEKRVSVARTNAESEGRKSKRMKRRRSAMPVRLEWKGDAAQYRVTVAREPDGKVFFSANVTSSFVEVSGLLEIAREWKWTVSDGESEVSSRFRTEDLAPRILTWPGVSNVRDIGGRKGLDGRRIRQGLVFRSGGLNNNAKGIYYTYDEIKQLEADGKLAGMGPLGAKYSAKVQAGKPLDKRYLRLKKPRPSEPGTARLTEEWRNYMCKKLGIKTDIDLRSAHERFGMTGSPLGPDVKFVTLEDELHGYSSVHTTGAEDMRRVLRVFLDRANYPIDFHCIGGADRTGTVAAILYGILGVDDDEIWKDYQITAWQGGVNDAMHLGWFASFMKSFDKFEGATLAERIQKYVLWLGFTRQDIDTIRNILLE